MKDGAHPAEMMVRCGKILGRLAVAAKRKDWAREQDRKVRQEVSQRICPTRVGRGLGTASPFVNL